MFKIFYLTNCGYSRAALETLEKFNISNLSNQINCDDKNNFTSDPNHVFVPSDYTSYPKILFVSKNSDSIFIGGNDELDKLINLVTTPIICTNEKIPSQRFISRRTTCKILLALQGIKQKQN